MAIQHARGFLWRGDDLGFGGGNARELSVTLQVTGSARPTLITQGFVGSFSVPFFGSSVTLAVQGRNRLLVNRNPRYWLTVTGVAANANGSTGNAVSFPVPPLQTFFLPQNLIGAATIAANSAWPIPQPLTGSPGSTVPLATGTNALTFDWLLEN